MNPDILLLVSVWDSMKHYVPKKDPIEAAEHLVNEYLMKKSTWVIHKKI